jgi:hypothetical protein
MFCLIWNHKTSRDIRKKNRGLGAQQEVLNMDIPWHNWLILSSESSKYFLFGLIWNYKTTKDIRKKNRGLGDQQEVLTIWIFSGTTGSYWVQSPPNIFCFVLFGIIRLQETFEKKLRAGDQQQVLKMDVPWHN